MRKYFTSLWFLGMATLIGFPLLAWPILYYTDSSFQEILYVRVESLYTLPAFLAAGIIFGLLVIWLTELPFFKEALDKYRNLLSSFKITVFHAFFLSFCAGFGEEVFFRGAVQPLLGIWTTAIFFVAIHGYYSFTNWKVNIFAVSLTFFIVLLGWGAREFSLWHAIAGHFSYDLVLLMYHRSSS